MPKLGGNAVDLPALHIEDRAALHHRADLIKHRDLLAPLRTAVIVIGKELF